MNEHFKIGYCKPPQHTRFKPGQPSANPRGRPPKRDNLPPGTAAYLAALKVVLERPLRTPDGKKVMPLEAVAMKLLQMALNGDVAAARELFRQSAQIPYRDPAKEQFDIEKTLDKIYRLSGLGPYVPEAETPKDEKPAASTASDDPPAS